MFHKDFKSRCFFPKIHFMDSQINKVHSTTIFCVVLSYLMGFFGTLQFPLQFRRFITYNTNRQGVQLRRPLTAECLQNFAKFLALLKVAQAGRRATWKLQAVSMYTVCEENRGSFEGKSEKGMNAQLAFSSKIREKPHRKEL